MLKIDPLKESLPALRRLSTAMITLAESAPERMSASQLIFFVLAGTEDLAGRDPTYSGIREAIGDKINRALHNTYRILLEPNRAYPNGLGWLRQEPSPLDARVKFLRLTPKGKTVLRQVIGDWRDPAKD